MDDTDLLSAFLENDGFIGRQIGLEFKGIGAELG